MVSRYGYFPPTKRWPMAIFEWMIQVASLNGFVLHKNANPNESLKMSAESTRRQYLSRLSDQLMEYQKERSILKYLYKNFVYRRDINSRHWTMDEYLKLAADTNSLHRKALGLKKGNREKCQTCGNTLNESGFLKCDECQQKFCLEHARKSVVCQSCENPKPPPEPKQPRLMTRNAKISPSSARCYFCPKGQKKLAIAHALCVKIQCV